MVKMKQTKVLMKSKVILLLALSVLMLIFAGCSSSYEHLLGEEAANETVNNISNMQIDTHINFRTWMMNLSLKVSEACKVPAIIGIPISIIIGIVLLNVFKNTASIKKTAWLLFIIGIPLILLTLAWGTAILYTILYQN